MKKFKSNILRSAFTLAEVLITLGIIGVVAALTISTLMNNINDMELKTAWKKDYAVIAQAISRLASDNNGDLGNGVFDISNFNNTRDAIKPYVLYTKACDRYSSFNNCWPGNYKNLDGTAGTWPDLPSIMLSNGSTIMIAVLNPTCTGAINNIPDVCGYIPVDVNGMKGPNVQGRDEFSLWVTRTGAIKPEGTTTDGRDTWCANKVGQGCSAPALLN